MSALYWLTSAIDVLAALGFVVVAAMSAKRVGAAASWLLAAIGVIDVVMILLFRLVNLTTDQASSFSTFERTLQLLEMVDAATMVLSGGLALVAFFLMMPKTPR